MKSLSVKLGIVLIGLAIFTYVEVWGEDWKFLRMSKGGDNCYYDADGITWPSKDIVRGSVKIVYSEKSVNREIERPGSSYKDLSYSIILWEMHCIEKKAALLQITTYSKNENVIKSIKYDAKKWASIVPETMGEDLYKELCK
jgi:Surface-adhesin protein E